VKFCPNCGTSLQVPNPSFCTECGFNLRGANPGATAAPIKPDSQVDIVEATVSPDEDEIIQTAKPNVYELGTALEDTVQRIFEKMGYSVEKRQRPDTKTGAALEIDLVLTRGKRRKAVECKNYSTIRVSAKELRLFQNKLEDARIDSGIFVTSSDFTREALQFAQARNIEHWDNKELREMVYAYLLNRLATNPSLVQDSVLPVRQDFSAASNLALRNSDAVKLFSSVLIYHPYIVTRFRLSAKRKDPTGKIHLVMDEGALVIDALDGDIINKEEGVFRVIGGLLQSKEERAERKEDKLVTQDVLNLRDIREPVLKTSEYEVSIAEPSITEVDARTLTKAYVAKKNSKTVRYEPKKKKRDDEIGLPDVREMKIVPKQNEVTIRGQKMVLVPKWSLEYESGRRSYQRRSLASSGSIIEDGLAKCLKCTVIHRDTMAVCEECGVLLCDKHAHQEDSRWLCEDHISEELRAQVKSKSISSRLFGKR
jgi:hypothetical protein